MKVFHFVEGFSSISGGIKTSIRHQRMAMDHAGIERVDQLSAADVVHLNVLGPKSLWVMYEAHKKDIPVVMHTHTTAEDFRESLRFSSTLSPLVDLYTKKCYSRPDTLIAPSAYTKRLITAKGIDVPIEVVSNGINTERLESVEVTDNGTDEFTAINLGFVFERKGLSDFIAVGENMPEADFTWFGPRTHSLLAGTKTRWKMWTAPENVSFPGYIDDINDAFAMADAFFFPTKEENQGISLLEAAYCGVPIVVRDIGAYDGVIEDGTHCLKGESVEDFEAALRRLRARPAERKRLVDAARNFAEQHDLRTVGKELHRVYEDTIESYHA